MTNEQRTKYNDYQRKYQYAKLQELKDDSLKYNIKLEYQKKYRENHKIEASEYHKTWKKENSQKVKTIRKNWNARNREKIREYNRQRKKTLKYKFYRYKYNAKKRDKIFCLSYEEFLLLIKGKCFYCGSDEHVGIDRKDNKIGYTIENSVSCCWDCNRLKGCFNSEDFISVCQKVSNNLINI